MPALCFLPVREAVEKAGMMRILAIDDDPMIFDILAECLPSDEGYSLDFHLNPQSAFEALDNASTPFDCILLDIKMPGMNGIEMCQILRKMKRHATVPVLMITGSAELGLMAEAFNAGATDFITKPLAKLELRARVNSAGLLNQTLAQAGHALTELSQLTKIQFDEPVSLKASGISDVIALENLLLRVKASRFSMTLLKLDISGLRGIYRAVSPIAYRHCLEMIGSSAVRATRGTNVELAYVGSGRFFGICLDRSRLRFDTLTERFNETLQSGWGNFKTGVPLAPTGRFSIVSAQRIWSGGSACDALRHALTDAESFTHLPLHHENDLFSRLDTILGISET